MSKFKVYLAHSIHFKLIPKEKVSNILSRFMVRNSIMSTKSVYLHLSMFLMVSSFISCGGSKNVVREASTTNEIVQYATNYIGTPYRYGGTNNKGMDCSGLIYTSFIKYDQQIPRTTKGLSKFGQKISINKVRKGDLLFFKTSKKWGKINHVGLVVRANRDRIEFIHSTTSRGVIISEIDEKYWNNAYKFARRVL